VPLPATPRFGDDGEVSSSERVPAAAPVPLPAWLVPAGALGVLALVSATRMYFGYRAAGASISLGDALGSGVLEWIVWAPLLPLVRRLARRPGLERGRLLAAAGIHLVAATACALAALVLFAALSALVRELRFGTGSLRSELGAGFLLELHVGVAFYGAALFAFVAHERERRASNEAVRHAELARALTEARLAVLQAQLAPHFLFNTLNGIAAVVRDDPDLAERMLEHLGALLRTVLSRRAEVEQSLEEEFRFVARYLELERLRAGPRLATELALDPAAADTRVPSFLLQPLVENAVAHGLGARSGTVHVGARVVGDDVEVAIEDDGPGGGERERPPGHGLGIASARERLALAFGERSRLALETTAAGGTRVRLVVPRAGAAS
jgi:hypothetical protein